MAHLNRFEAFIGIDRDGGQTRWCKVQGVEPFREKQIGTIGECSIYRPGWDTRPDWAWAVYVAL